MCADTSPGAVIRDLVGKACKGPLAPAEHEVCPAYLFTDGCANINYSTVHDLILLFKKLQLQVY